MTMNDITDRQHYVEAMRKTLDQKLFFMDKLDPDFILDFGCADGALVEAALGIKPEMVAWGYDNDSEMIKDVSEYGKGLYTIDLKLALQCAKEARGTRVLVLSSVLHEIYSACGHDEIRTLWKNIQEVGFDFIVVRDMLYDSTSEYSLDLEVSAIFDKEPVKAKHFEKVWGSLRIRQNFVHFLLTYRYTENWDREVEEDYLSINRHELLETFKLIGYQFEYWEQHNIHFIKKSIHDDFFIRLDDNTHVKAIFKKK